MEDRIVVFNQDGTFTKYSSMNALVDAEEETIRAYLAQKDKFEAKDSRKKELRQQIQKYKSSLQELQIELNQLEESEIQIIVSQEDWD